MAAWTRCPPPSWSIGRERLPRSTLGSRTEGISKMVFSNSCSRLPVLAVLLCLPALWPQSPANERLTVGQPQKVAGKRNETVHTRIPISILPGYHVNSNTPSEDYLIPLSLTWSAPGSLEGGQVTYPKPTIEKYEFAEKPLSVYTGNFELAVSFKVAATGRPRRGRRQAALSGLQRQILLPAENRGRAGALLGAVRPTGSAGGLCRRCLVRCRQLLYAIKLRWLHGHLCPFYDEGWDAPRLREAARLRLSPSALECSHTLQFTVVREN